MAHLSLSLLGPFQATLDGQPIAGLRTNKVCALLAYLARVSVVLSWMISHDAFT